MVCVASVCVFVYVCVFECLCVCVYGCMFVCLFVCVCCLCVFGCMIELKVSKRTLTSPTTPPTGSAVSAACPQQHTPADRHACAAEITHERE